ncbi:MAG: 5-amino-6-(D-ribitylamino)uracil--L-tyrosine 4-hydroxyphenyl transferase CofH [Rhodospirillaceae bacterium]|nr:5-amino-6-(D-ribitylamino)uracil--L-tyrosine 4-hydroxyphenyl transferase CofH [Rhodospirillaceae bacterium]MBT7293231.1 5-amino-6-(D-ribitylamino)uracil--L-tyrosine 4-hydroxyphenyl transferase CofH [Rhodospirillaceae bacterium]
MNGIAKISSGAEDLLQKFAALPQAELEHQAATLRDSAHPDLITYSRKVFIPLTQLCRDVCHYCTFAHPPRKGERAFLTADEILKVARDGAEAGCKEALFTLGDKPELRYQVVRRELAEMGHATTLSYLADMAALVHRETGLLPHLNPGVLTREDMLALRKVSVSQGLMLESLSERLTQKGMAHHGSPDKQPAARLETLRLAGELAVPFTTGILIGIGETRLERLESLVAIQELQARYGHIQEVIIQNFRAKPGTRMAEAPEPDLNELRWTIACARLIFGPEMNIQAPPNLSPGGLAPLVGAGINDWGGVSPVTPDFVNPEAPWPHLDALARDTAACGKRLSERLALYPAYARTPKRWLEPAMETAILQASDADGLARTEDWSPGTVLALPVPESIALPAPRGELLRTLAKAEAGENLSEAEIVSLFQARGPAFEAVCQAADRVRAEMSGDVIRYVVNRNINYTNICYFRCQFCAFSKGKMSENLRGRPYDLKHEEIARRVAEGWQRGATEVCMQGGIHPDYSGQTYLDICRTVKEAAPDMHIHAFSPLEVWQGAETLGIPLRDFLAQLKGAGLGSLPGTAAEILDDEIRAIICADKINTRQWLEVMETAHSLGIKTTSTIMYGHVETPNHWARHLLRLRELQARTGGFTEFVPLPFVHMEAPIYLKGQARKGPTYREAILMHAVARLALHPHISNIQTSWVKMGPEGAKACLNAGANDLGGTLMNETITRSAGASWGQEMPPEEMDALIASIDRTPERRSTLYGPVEAERIGASLAAGPLMETINNPPQRIKNTNINHA